jgi:Protein of unknown function, DUF481
MRPRAWLVAVILASFAAVASASDRTDVIVLNNGDRITGEILNLSRGRVELKTDHAGTIEVEWDKIVTIESRRQFTVATSDGRRVVGRLGRGAARTVQLGTATGDLAMAMDEITGIEPLGQSFWTKLEGSVGAGFNYTRSSGVSQFTTNSDVTYRRPSFVASMDGAATLTNQSDEGNGYGKVANAEFMYARYRGRRFFMAGAAQVETNESLGLTLRSQVGGLAGARLVNTNRSQLQIGAGISGNQERGVDVDPTKNIEGLVVLKGSYYTYDRPKTNLDLTLQYYPSLSDWGRQRFQLNTSAKREVWKDFYVSLNLYDTFDSAPPTTIAARNDVGVTLSINWSFGS